MKTYYATIDANGPISKREHEHLMSEHVAEKMYCVLINVQAPGLVGRLFGRRKWYVAQTSASKAAAETIAGAMATDRPGTWVSVVPVKPKQG